MKKNTDYKFCTTFLACWMWAKKATTASSSSKSETLQSTLPVLENAEKNTVVTKTFMLPKSTDGSQQIQTVTYKGKQFFKFDYYSKRPVTDELKTFVTEHGVEATQKALIEAEGKDTSIQEARKLPGFTLETKILSETEIQTTTTYDFQVLDIKKLHRLNI